MKKNLIIIVVGIIILVLGVYFLTRKDNDSTIPSETKDKITFETDKNVNYSVGYINNDSFLAIILTNNDEKNIVSSKLIIDYGTYKKEETLNLFPVGGKYLITTQVPSNLIDNIRNQKIKIKLVVNEFDNNFSFIDVNRLEEPITKFTIDNNITIIDVSGTNNLKTNISSLNGFVVLYKDNKIVGAQNFSISDINNNSSYNTQVKFDKIIAPNSNLTQSTSEFAPIEYNKLQVIYTFAY